MLTLLFLAIIGCAQGLNSRIIGGDKATVNKYPYQVSIHYNGLLHCGGSIISKQWILTAAHCLYGKTPSLFKIRIGSTYSSKEGKLFTGVTIISHEFYDDDTGDYDVGLIKLPTPIAFDSKAKPVVLASPMTNVPVGSVAVVTGWGKTSFGDMSNTLQSLKVPTIDQNTCLRIYIRYNEVTSRMICAGHLNGGKDTCQGDSGGPLVYNGVQIGIVSWGAECARAGFPGVYTRVSAIRSWITKRANV